MAYYTETEESVAFSAVYRVLWIRPTPSLAVNYLAQCYTATARLYG